MEDEKEDFKLIEVDIKEEAHIPNEDDEFEFEFLVDDSEYDEILKDLKAKDSELEELEGDESELCCLFPGCKRIFTRKYNLVRHQKSHQVSSENGHICHVCGKNIKGVYSLHLKIHENLKQFRCPDCGREFRQKVALSNHMLIHRNEKPYQCPWCYKPFRQKYTMRTHIKRHTGVKDFICDLCGKEFTDKMTLQKHSLVHSTSKPHQCSTCFMSFRHKSSLSRHTKIHLKTTQCHLCSRSFRYESFLKKHLIAAHQDENAINDPEFNEFSKSSRSRYIDQDEDIVSDSNGEELEENEQHIEIHEDQNQLQIIQVDPAQYQYAETSTAIIVNNVHSYT